MAINGKEKGQAQKESAPIDVRSLITMMWPFYLNGTRGHRFYGSCSD